MIGGQELSPLGGTMKKLVCFLLLIALLPTVLLSAMSRFPNGIVVGNTADEASASVTPGEKDIFVDGTLEVDGAARLDSTLTMTGVATFTGQPIFNGGIDVNEDVDIDLDAADEEFNLTHSSHNVVAMTIYNSVADLTDSYVGLSIDLADNADSDGIFMRCRDNSAANTVFQIGVDGAITIDVSGGGSGTVLSEASLVSNDATFDADSETQDFNIGDGTNDTSFTDNGVMTFAGTAYIDSETNDCTIGDGTNEISITDNGVLTFAGTSYLDCETNDLEIGDGSGNQFIFTDNGVMRSSGTSYIDSETYDITIGDATNEWVWTDNGAMSNSGTADMTFADGTDINISANVNLSPFLSSGTADTASALITFTGGITLSSGATMENGLVLQNDIAGQFNIDDTSGNSMFQVTDAGTTGNADVSGTLGVTGNTTMTKLTCNGDFTLNSFVTLTATGTVTISSSTFVLMNDADDCSLYLPDAATSDGKIFIVKQINASGTVTLDATAGGNIDGSNTNTDLGAQYDVVGIVSDGTNWHIFLEVE